MSNNYMPGPNDGLLNNDRTLVNRREMHANSMTGALPPIIRTPERVSSFDFEQMIASLHELFEHDRQVVSVTYTSS